MRYSKREVLEYIREEDVKFIRLAFSDVYGVCKNLSVMPSELERAFEQGISFDASAVRGFGGEVHSDLFLVPDPATLSVLPWRPSHGKVVRMLCDIRRSDGSPFEPDPRRILKNAVAKAEEAGIQCDFGAEFEFYLFKTDENGAPTSVPFDQAGYMDIAPEDGGENVRREICLTLTEMGIFPECSHHEEGPGQNEIDFRYSDALSAADNAGTFCMVVRTVAARNGLYASFDPKPLPGHSGSGMHINISFRAGREHKEAFLAGILEHIRDITVFLNASDRSYLRLGSRKAPRYVSWSEQNRSQLVRIPAAERDRARIELRSPDAGCNPYLAFALLLQAGLDGVKRGLVPPPPVDCNLFTAGPETLSKLAPLPSSLREAAELMQASRFVRDSLPPEVIEAYRVLADKRKE